MSRSRSGAYWSRLVYDVHKTPFSGQERCRATRRKVGPTDDRGNALVSGDRFFVVALAPLERLCKVYGRLVRLALEVQFVDAALRDH